MKRLSRPTMSHNHRSSTPDRWTMPRPHRDASLRYMMHGPILPMEEPGLLSRLWRFSCAPARLFGRR